MRNTKLLLNSSAMLALALVASTGAAPVIIPPPPSDVPELTPYYQRGSGRNKGEKKRNKARRWG